MTRTPVRHADIVAAIVTALNNTTMNGGTLSAVAHGQEVIVHAHVDSGQPQSRGDQFAIFVH